jgi:two-component sensor histidine kinase
VNELIAERSRRTEDIPSPVHLSLKQLSSGFIALTVHDQHASPTDAPASQLSSKLIANMTAQIEGEFHEEISDDGLRATVTFPGKGT